MPKMYTKHNGPNGILEIEVGDWKDNRIFRVMTIDQGDLTLVDMHFNPDQSKSTVVTVTNPKDHRRIVNRNTFQVSRQFVLMTNL